MGLTTIYQLKTFADIYTAVREELKIQSTDTTAIQRIKRDINIVYLEEVIPFAQWKWLRGVFDATVYAAIQSGTASVTQGSPIVTLTSAITSPKDGWLFGVTGYNEVYRIASHSASSAVLNLQVPYTGTTTTTASYKVWTDEIYLPSFVRETFEISHDFQDQPLESCGLQKYRQYVAALPRAEGRPYFYTTNNYSDPIAYVVPSGMPAISTRSSNTLTKTLTFASDVSNYVQQGDRIQISGCTEPSYNGEFVVSSQSAAVVTYTAMVPTYETAIMESALTLKRAQPSSDTRRAKRILVYPAIYTQNTTLHIDYIREAIGLADDTDEPLMPIGDRTVLLYGALNRAWSRERNPEEAKRNFDLFSMKLGRMAGKMDDSVDQPRLQISKIYLGAKRMAQRQRDTKSGIPESWGGGSAGGQVITGTGNRAAIFDSTGALTASAVLANSELIQLSGILSKAVGISDSQTLTNKVLSISGAGANNISGGTASTVAIWNGATLLGSSSVTTTELGQLSGILSKAVGITDTQVLTNKTISSSANTITGISDTNIVSTGLSDASISSTANIQRSKIAASTAFWVVTNDTNGRLTGVAPGTSGNLLTSDGTQWNSTTPASSPDSSNQIYNTGISCSVASSALTISFIDKFGATPSAGSPCKIGFRNSTASIGNYVIGTVSGATTMTLANGSSLGSSGGVTYYPYVYGLFDQGFVNLAVSMMDFDEGTRVSTVVAEGGGSSTSNAVIYASSAHSNVPIRKIARLTTIQTKAGLWATAPSEIALNPMQKVAIALRVALANTQSLSASTPTAILYDTVLVNTHNGYVISTGEWICMKAGLYIFHASTEFNSSNVGQRAQSLAINGNAVAEIGQQSSPATGTTTRVNGSTQYQLAVGDRVTIQAFQSTVGSLNIGVSGTTYTHLSIEFITDKY